MDHQIQQLSSLRLKLQLLNVRVHEIPFDDIAVESTEIRFVPAVRGQPETGAQNGGDNAIDYAVDANRTAAGHGVPAQEGP